MGECGIDDRGIVMRVEGAWNLGGMGMLRAGLMPLPPLLFDRGFTLSNLKSLPSWETITERQSVLLFNRPLRRVR